MYIDTQDKASDSYPLAPIDSSSMAGISRQGSSQDGVSSSISDINSSPAEDLNDPFSDARGRFAHLTLTPTQKNNTFDSNSTRSQELKALAVCEKVKEIGLSSMEHWGKSFDLTTQELLFEDLEPLESLKKKTNSEMIQGQFEDLVQFSAGLQSHLAEFQALRKPFDDLASAEHTSVDQQMKAAIQLGEELDKHAESLGQNASIILRSQNKIWKFQESSVQETQNKIESLLREQHDYQEDKQFAMDMVKDIERIVPRSKEPSGLVATALEGVGKYKALKRGQMYKNKQTGSKMLQDVYKAEKSKTDALCKRLDQSKESIQMAYYGLTALNEAIYTNIVVVLEKLDDASFSPVAITKELDATEAKLLTFKELLDEFLARTTQEYGLELSTREFKSSYSRVPNIYTALAMLLSAREVVANDHQIIYEIHIYKLCRIISTHFEVMQEAHQKCRSATNLEHLTKNLAKFKTNVAIHLQGIKDIAETHISKAKTKEAYQKRAQDDRFHGNSASTRAGRPLVTGGEILWALNKVIDAVLLIQLISGASAAPNQSAIEGANRIDEAAANANSLAWFKLPKEMMNQFFVVLFNEAEKLKFLKDKGQAKTKSNSKEEPTGHFARFRRFMTPKSGSLFF